MDPPRTPLYGQSLPAVNPFNQKNECARERGEPLLDGCGTCAGVPPSRHCPLPGSVDAAWSSAAACVDLTSSLAARLRLGCGWRRLASRSSVRPHTRVT